jgi:hypothetical protein
LVEAYLALAPGDSLGWQLLASARYLAGDELGALQAWNQLGDPTIDSVLVSGSTGRGLARVEGAVALGPGAVLTASDLGLARRRLSELPAIGAARIGVRPVTGGLAHVRVHVAERPLLDPLGRLALRTAIGALERRAVRVELANPLGVGELWSAEWRWEHARPRSAIRFDAPANVGVPGVLHGGVSYQRVRIATGAEPGGTVEDAWYGSAVGYGAWLSPKVRQSVDIGFERWEGRLDYLTFGASTQFRPGHDRFRTEAGLLVGAPRSGQPGYWLAGARAMWASSLGLSRASWSGRVGFDVASNRAPLGLRPRAGGGLSEPIPLRAEPSPGNRALAGRTVGTAVMHGGLTGDQPVWRNGLLGVAVGAFVDAARVVESVEATTTDRDYLDAGVGIRLGIAQGALGVVRIDVATGLLSGRRSAVTVGLHREWPVFPHVSR